MQCEGWRRYGGVFTFGPVTWRQCENEAVVIMTVIQEKKEDLPGCMECWQEAIECGITIEKVVPITGEKNDP